MLREYPVPELARAGRDAVLDVVALGSAWTRDAALDVTIRNPCTPGEVAAAATANAACATAAEAHKRRTYPAAQGIEMTPFAVEVFGRLGGEAEAFLTEAAGAASRRSVGQGLPAGRPLQRWRAALSASLAKAVARAIRTAQAPRPHPPASERGIPSMCESPDGDTGSRNNCACPQPPAQGTPSMYVPPACGANCKGAGQLSNRNVHSRPSPSEQGTPNMYVSSACGPDRAGTRRNNCALPPHFRARNFQHVCVIRLWPRSRGHEAEQPRSVPHFRAWTSQCVRVCRQQSQLSELLHSSRVVRWLQHSSRVVRRPQHPSRVAQRPQHASPAVHRLQQTSSSLLLPMP